MVKIITTVKGGRGFATQLDRWTGNLKNMRPAYEAVADYQANEWAKQFRTGGAYYGTRWPALSPAYARWKAANFPGKPILVRTGRLRDSLTSRPLGIEEFSSKGVRLGSDVEYAQFHQRGTPFMPRRQLYPTTPQQARARNIAKIMQRHIVSGR